MPEHSFTLYYRLPQGGPAENDLVDRLATRCSDATLGLGRAGHFALMFTREATDFLKAYRSAQADVLLAVPGAQHLKSMLN